MRIIVIDEERHSLDTLMTEIFKAAPRSKIKGFCSPEKGIEYVKEKGVNVAFLDAEMPSMGGLILAKHLNQIAETTY